jgi:hypothetical protein
MGKGPDNSTASANTPSAKTGTKNMLRKLTIALVATVSLGAVLAPSIASAKGGGFGGGHHHFGGGHHHFGGGGFGEVVGVVDADFVETTVVDESCFVTQRVVTPWGFRMRTINVCAD